jgi:uncharacterized membrane protein YciS (DUF1049 family)
VLALVVVVVVVLVAVSLGALHPREDAFLVVFRAELGSGRRNLVRGLAADGPE